MNLNRRDFLALSMGTGLLGVSSATLTKPLHDFRVRTITAGVRLADIGDLSALEKANSFLGSTRDDFQSHGYEVQTLRMATQPLSAYLEKWHDSSSLELIQQLDQFAVENKLMLSLGPVNFSAMESDEFSQWLIQLITATSNISCTLDISSSDRREAISQSAKVITGVAGKTKGGEGNFRFAAVANCPPGSPFFPAAYYDQDAVSLGLESADLLFNILQTGDKAKDKARLLKEGMEKALLPVQKLAQETQKETGLPFLGIDTSPAPNLDVSIGRVIETLSGRPFGAPSTLSACALITDVLKSLKIKTCGYSGLMLPVLEDTVLARRAEEGRYSVSDLLLFSSVCGTGLDVVPLPGNVSTDAITALISDVAALSQKYSIALSARLFPIPGKDVGEKVSFDNPYLSDAVIMDIQS